MADRATYNAYNGVTGQFIDRFQGVYNDGLGCNLQPSLVDYAENAEDQWRGAVKKREGYVKHLSKGYPIWAFSNVFDGYYLQGDNDVWYRTDLLLDYRRVPGTGGGSYEDVLPDDETKIYEGYDDSTDNGNPDTFTGSPPTGTGEYYTGIDEWRYRHIAQSINARRVAQGLLPVDPLLLPTETPDANITYILMNNARQYIALLTQYYYKSKDVINALPQGTTIFDSGLITFARALVGDYHNLLTDTNIGGLLLGVREWSNNTATDTIAYRALVIPTDIINSLMFTEMEIAIRGLRYGWAFYQQLQWTNSSPVTKYIDLSDAPIWYSWSGLDYGVGYTFLDNNSERIPIQSGKFNVNSENGTSLILNLDGIDGHPVDNSKFYNRAVNVTLGTATFYKPATLVYAVDNKLGRRSY